VIAETFSFSSALRLPPSPLPYSHLPMTGAVASAPPDASAPVKASLPPAADGHRAAHAGLHAARHGRTFFHRDAAEQGGIDIIAVGDAVVVHPHVHGLLRAVDGNGDSAFAADAADIGRNRAA